MASARVAKAAAAAGAAACIGVGIHYRPRPSTDTEYHEKHGGELWRRPESGVTAVLYNAASMAVLGVTSTVIQAAMHLTQDIEVIDQWKLDRFTNTDRRGRALLTVTNHHSCLDDPALVSCLVPMGVRFSPKKMRWGVCTEEMCFFNPVGETYFGLGKAFPILRGGTLDQRATAFVLSRLDVGDWVHVFPEGRTWQEGGMPPRDEEHRWCTPTGRCTPPWSRVGPFKWGIGKLIANSKRPPIVVPFYHMGMQNFLPQSSENEVISWIPKLGNKITVKMGDPVEVDDLLIQYHEDAQRRADERAKKRPALPSAREDAATEAAVFAAASPAKKDTEQETGEETGEETGGEAGRGRGGEGGEGMFARARHAVEEAEKRAEKKVRATVDRLEHEAEEVAESIKDRIRRFRGEFEDRVKGMREYYERPPPRGEEDEAGRAMIPSKTLGDGTVVPGFRDGPLRIRPPDHELLTEEEAKLEHEIRLKLYKDITARVEAATVKLAFDVDKYRKVKGHDRDDVPQS